MTNTAIRVSVDETAQTLMAGLIREGGATVRRGGDGAMPTHGYLVGGLNETKIRREDFRSWRVTNWLSEVSGVEYVGIWEDDGIIYLDGSDWVAKKSDAHYLGGVSNQIAIWDCENNVSVSVHPSLTLA